MTQHLCVFHIKPHDLLVITCQKSGFHSRIPIAFKYQIRIDAIYPEKIL